ncbi:MAG: hypothetical protein IAA97_07170 [Spirochaetes bacterium]|uniref:Uncharacterized protein n=1 Tax=Candidatus Ornithospirochaeta stercoripullorum TaxID=2840899 RepID=A0A9D9E225_9SPIO|nr:hypothetical protein [Candidatus Ornithospirochaeta stercoripullorum]
MNTKKAIWINKPEHIKATLHTLSFKSESAHSVFFVLGEEEEIKLSYKAETTVAFVLMHTEEDYIVFKDNAIVLLFSGIRTEIPHAAINELELIKKGPALTFKSGDDEILAITKTAFRTSVSFGISAKGCGEVVLEVF